MNCRRFLGGAAACLGVPRLATRPQGRHVRTRLISLATAAGVARQLVLARVPGAILVALTIPVLASCRTPISIRRASPAIPTSDDESAIVVHDHKHGLDGVRAVTGAVRLSLRGDSSHIGDSLLVVEYSPPTSDPAARDVRLDAAATDWSAGHALSFRILPASAVRLSVSFLDRNRVAYTSWIQLDPDRGQTIRIPFENLRPNPYFQPPDAKTGGPIDVSRVSEIAFAPQGSDSGRFVMSRIVVVE